MYSFFIYLDGILIDKVGFLKQVTEQQAKRELVLIDGYDASISVVKC